MYCKMCRRKITKTNGAACPYCGWKEGTYGRYKTKEHMIVFNEGKTCVRVKAKRVRLTRYNERNQRMFREILNFLKANQGTAYSRFDLQYELHMMSTKGMTRIMKLMKDQGIIMIKKIDSIVYYAYRSG